MVLGFLLGVSCLFLDNHVLKDGIVNRIILHLNAGVGDRFTLLDSLLNIEHVGVYLREALLFTDLLADIFDSSCHLINVSTLFIVRGINVVAVLSHVLKIPVSELHIITSCNSIVSSNSSLNHTGILSWDQHFSARTFRFICLLYQSISILGGFEEFIV